MAEALKVYTDDAETYVYSALRASDDVEKIAGVLDGMVARILIGLGITVA